MAISEEPTNQEPQPSQEERNWNMAVHLSALAGYIVPFANIWGPLVIWLVKRQQFPGIEAHGKAAVNFNISITIYAVVSAILILVIVGIFLLPALAVFHVVITVMAAVKANNGEPYKYPLSINFLN